ncbi:hypothetical protein ROZALSC1DRAFT_29451 [Rozella allomycis CSF55]|uniref:Chitin synthase III catalytic subunit domain-containing protein n=1 Tax=Rozella allomycis (strain CSF55) TaxID=988480 RepID=A0A075AVG7_ROZAC|nr:Chitin synthase III catalytic subunit domain-containing protein [Rozella allomycis CSF55]RKP18899.1 hypothetical protein ROZALSC1DRAFT_29451 [Rozella allomycis CSF55]|eukprot:EPZ34321.1 Chitin synthase III catalytic subunit domain-containing protein [Rozella allomycis CSF55]
MSFTAQAQVYNLDKQQKTWVSMSDAILPVEFVVGDKFIVRAVDSNKNVIKTTIQSSTIFKRSGEAFVQWYDSTLKQMYGLNLKFKADAPKIENFFAEGIKKLDVKKEESVTEMPKAGDINVKPKKDDPINAPQRPLVEPNRNANPSKPVSNLENQLKDFDTNDSGMNNVLQQRVKNLEEKITLLEETNVQLRETMEKSNETYQKQLSLLTKDNDLLKAALEQSSITAENYKKQMLGYQEINSKITEKLKDITIAYEKLGEIITKIVILENERNLRQLYERKCMEYEKEMSVLESDKITSSEHSRGSLYTCIIPFLSKNRFPKNDTKYDLQKLQNEMDRITQLYDAAASKAVLERDEIMSELESLTSRLFEEANSMVATETKLRFQLEKSPENILNPFKVTDNFSFANFVDFLVATLGFLISIILAWKANRKTAAVGRREMATGFTIFSLCMISTVFVSQKLFFNGHPLIPKYIASVHITLVSCLAWLVLFNGFVGYQILIDGQAASLFLMIIGMLIVGVTSFITCASNFLEIPALQFLKGNVVLEAIGMIFPFVCVFIYIVLQVILVLKSLGVYLPLGYLAAMSTTFGLGILFNFVIVKPISYISQGVLDGSSIGTFYFLLTGILTFLFWNSITEDEEILK